MPKDFNAAVQRVRAAAVDQSQPSAIRPHVRSIEAQLAAIANGDYASVLDDATEDVELEILAPPEFPFIRRARGRDQFLEAVEKNFTSVDDQRPEIVNVVAQGDTVVLIGRESGVLRETRLPYQLEFVHRFTFREGRLASVRIIAANST